MPIRTLSVRSCRTTRPRLAPSARRVPISRRRLAALARRRFVTFAHASSTMRPTVVKRTAATASVVRFSRSSDSTCTVAACWPGLRSRSSAAAIERTSVSACARVTPGFVRPKTSTAGFQRRLAAARSDSMLCRRSRSPGSVAVRRSASRPARVSNACRAAADADMSACPASVIQKAGTPPFDAELPCTRSATPTMVKAWPLSHTGRPTISS